MATKKKQQVKTGDANVEDTTADYPNKYQTVKGIQYLRPLHFAATAEGVMAWVPDVDNYPDQE